MRFQNCSPALAGTFLGLLLAGCGDGLAGPGTVPEPETAALATEQSGDLPDLAEAPLVVLVVPDRNEQSRRKITNAAQAGGRPTPGHVAISLGDGRIMDGRFQTTLQARKDGKARGHARVEYRDPYEEGGRSGLVRLTISSSLRRRDALRIVASS